MTSAAKIELLGMASPNVQKVAIALEELRLDYDFTFVAVHRAEHLNDAFLALNPTGKVPVLINRRGDGPETVVFESGAILLYLAESAARLIPAEAAARLTVIEWLMVQMSRVGPMLGQYIHFLRYVTDKGYAFDRYRDEALRILALLDRRLAQSAWLGGDTYSIADIATYPWITTAADMGLPVAEHAALSGWVETIAARPAVTRFARRFEAVFAETNAARATATPEQLDRYLGRAGG